MDGRMATGGGVLAPLESMLAVFTIPLSWRELLRRTAKDAIDDDCLGLAAQLAYYLFLALFPALLFVLAVASFFPFTDFIDDVIRTLRPIAPADVVAFLEAQLRRVADADSGGILTLGILGAIWSSSAAVTAIIGSLNRAYDIEEGRPWWKVRLIAIGLTLGLAILVLASFTLIVAGPAIAEGVAATFGLGAVFEWSWKILQWPLSFFLVSSAVGLIYYFAPDAEQEWVWITPGAVLGTLLWVAVSLGFKFYLANFADYNATYGAVGGVIVLLLWFYMSGLAILLGAELNAEIEHASPHGKDPGEKVPGQRTKIGVAAARAYEARLATARTSTPPQSGSDRSPDKTVQDDMATNNDERTLKELFLDLSRDTRMLFQQELQLARTELSEKVSKLQRSAALIVGGGLLAYGGVLAIVAAVILMLVALGLPAWGAALLGGALLVGAGYMLLRSGLATLNTRELAPRQMMESLKEDAQWLKAQTK
jgi:membrane protein